MGQRPTNVDCNAFGASCDASILADSIEKRGKCIKTESKYPSSRYHLSAESHRP